MCIPPPPHPEFAHSWFIGGKVPGLFRGERKRAILVLLLMLADIIIIIIWSAWLEQSGFASHFGWGTIDTYFFSAEQADIYSA